MYATSCPDLVLLDINMPLMNGFELAQKIREQDRDVLIFFLTDRTEKADRLKGFDLKGNDYIPKSPGIVTIAHDHWPDHFRQQPLHD